MLLFINKPVKPANAIKNPYLAINKRSYTLTLTLIFLLLLVAPYIELLR